VYKIKEGSTGDWLEIQVRNHRTRLASLDMSSDGGSTWKPLSRTEYNYWVGRGVGNGPYAIRVTNDAGDQVTDNDIPFQIGIVSGKATI
jgi:expansin (peptidoglycan-binding protein)